MHVYSITDVHSFKAWSMVLICYGVIRAGFLSPESHLTFEAVHEEARDWLTGRTGEKLLAPTLTGLHGNVFQKATSTLQGRLCEPKVSR